jgi:hypothetical protein
MDRDFWREYEDVERLVLAAVRLGSKRGGLCCRTRIRVASFILTWEFEELAHLHDEFHMWTFDVDSTLKAFTKVGFLEEGLEFPGVVDGMRLPGYGVYTYRLTRAGRVLADRAVREMSPKVRRRLQELLSLDIWTLIGYAYVRYPEQFAYGDFDLA